jgi:hypothetical protein
MVHSCVISVTSPQQHWRSLIFPGDAVDQTGMPYALLHANLDSEDAMSRRSAIDPLKPVLRHVEEELQANVSEVCRQQDVMEETTGELEKLSDTLQTAARQAKAAAGLRRRMNSSNVSSRVNERLSTPPDSDRIGPDLAAADNSPAA